MIVVYILDVFKLFIAQGLVENGALKAVELLITQQLYAHLHYGTGKRKVCSASKCPPTYHRSPGRKA
jgi:hypothetical protein